MTALTSNPFSLSPFNAGSPSVSSSTRLPAQQASQRDFAEILGVANRLAAPAEADAKTQARAAAEQFIAQVLVQPMLAEVRNASTQPPPFGPGDGEKQFGSIIDAQRAMEMVRGSDWSIVNRVAADLERAARNTPDTADDTTQAGPTPSDPIGTHDTTGAFSGLSSPFTTDTRRMSFPAGS